MEVNAIVYYQYDVPHFGWESFDIVVKFRYGKRVFRIKKVYELASMKYVENSRLRDFKDAPYETKDEYFEYIHSILDDPNFKRKTAEEIIHIWAEENMKKNSENKKMNDILDKIDNDKKLKIKVNIKD